MTSQITATRAPLGMGQVLLCCALIVSLSMGVRHGFGLWLGPITTQHGWTRENFAFAIAVQNLCWGLFGPLAGLLADKHGAFRVLIGGAVLYAIGLAGMATMATLPSFVGSAGLLIGAAQAGTTYAILYGVIARNVDPAKRSWAMGITAAAGSFGQFLMVPLDTQLIDAFGWSNALLVLSLAVLAIIPLSFGLRENMSTKITQGAPQSVRGALSEAFAYPSFLLLTAGYFVCGFQVVFIGVHLPSYLKDNGFEPQVAANALALIGLFNVVGTYSAGVLGQKVAKRYILSSIYLLRFVAIAAFVLMPLSNLSVYLFASVMGLLWLSTVPPTNAIVAQIFGVQFMGMLGGFVFLSHQVGSFMGVWLGGKLYDATGSYNIVWWIAAALGLFAAVVNLPVRESAIARAAGPAAKAA
jgi:predicted MFS family arabinose efflux permease